MPFHGWSNRALEKIDFFNLAMAFSLYDPPITDSARESGVKPPTTFFDILAEHSTVRRDIVANIPAARIGNVLHPVQDIDKAIAFYNAVFGFGTKFMTATGMRL